MSLHRFLLDLIFPPSCVSCKTAGDMFCKKCLQNISFITPPVCNFCGVPVDDNLSQCSRCQLNSRQAIDAIRAASYFDDNPIRPAIHSFKYNNYKAAAYPFARMLVEAYNCYNLEADVIVPVPLHNSRFRERGYNQSEILAVEMGKVLGLAVDTTTLRRTRKTRPQMELEAAERYKNVVDAFACDNSRLKGQNILLIDDVCTTGSTLDACAVALKNSGEASYVLGLTLAKAVH